MTPKIAGVVETSLDVADMSRSVKFYAEILGFEPLDADERLTAIGVAGHQVLLLCKKGASKDWKVPHDGEGQLHVAFARARDQLESWESRLPNVAYRLSIEGLGHAADKVSISAIPPVTCLNSRHLECGVCTEDAARCVRPNRRSAQLDNLNSRTASPALPRSASRISEYFRERITPGAPARNAARTASLTLCGVLLL